MADQLPTPPRPPACPNHPHNPVRLACSRCGTLVCADCVAGSPADEPVCPACTRLHGYRTLMRPGAGFTVETTVSRAWGVFKAHWGKLLAATLIYFAGLVLATIPGVLAELIAGALGARGMARAALAAWILNAGIQLLAQFVGASLNCGFAILWLRLLRGQPAEVAQVFHGFRYGFYQFLLGLPFGLIGLLLPHTSFGRGLNNPATWTPATIALLVGSFLVAMFVLMRFAFVTTLLVDKGLGPIAALAGSWRLTSGRLGAVLLLFLAVLGVAFLGLLACCVGVIPAAGLIAGFFVVAYDALVYPGNDYLREA